MRRVLAGSGLTLLSLLALCGCLARDPLASDVPPGAERDHIDGSSRAAPPTHGVSMPAAPPVVPPVAPPVMQPAHAAPDADDAARMPVVAPDPDDDGAKTDADHDAAIDPPARPTCATGDAATFAGDFDDLQASIRMLESVTHVTGNLVLHDGSLPLPCLERVDGDLTITVTASLLGLDRLESVGGSLVVDGDNSMTFSSISGLSGLQSVGADLRLLNGWDVESLHGLEQLRSVGGDFVFDAAVALGDLSALSSLTRIGGTLELVGSSGAGSQFSSLHGVEGLTELGGLRLTSFDALTSLDGLPPLTRIGGDVMLNTLRGFTSLAALSTLQGIDGTLSLQNIDGALDLSPLSNLTQLGSLGLYQVSVNSLAPLSKLTALDTLSVAAAMTDLDGMQNLTSLRTLYLTGSSLTSLAQLHGITALESLSVTNTEVVSLDGLDNLETISGDVSLYGNTTLTGLDGLGKLTHVGGGILLRGDNAMTALRGPSALQSIDGAFVVEYMPTLTEVTGFDALEHVGSLSIAGNAALARVDAFAALTDPIASLSVYQNPSLPRCQAEAIAQRAQTACGCPSHTVSTCVPGCYQTGSPPRQFCTTCQGLDYCACDGVCNCNGNANTIVDCTQ